MLQATPCEPDDLFIIQKGLDGNKNSISISLSS